MFLICFFFILEFSTVEFGRNCCVGYMDDFFPPDYILPYVIGMCVEYSIFIFVWDGWKSRE